MTRSRQPSPLRSTSEPSRSSVGSSRSGARVFGAVDHNAVFIEEEQIAPATGNRKGDLAQDHQVGIPIVVDVAGDEVLFVGIDQAEAGAGHDAGAGLVDVFDPVRRCRPGQLARQRREGKTSRRRARPRAAAGRRGLTRVLAEALVLHDLDLQKGGGSKTRRGAYSGLKPLRAIDAASLRSSLIRVIVGGGTNASVDQGPRETAMQAVICDQYGRLEDLRLGEMEDPVAGPGEVLLEVAAAGVNFPDLLLVRGSIPVQADSPGGAGRRGRGQGSGCW